MLKLWKGLFYCMWMSDKPLVQEDLAETISALVHSFANRQTGLLYSKVALTTMAREWGGIDTWRMEKFLMVILTHRLLRGIQRVTVLTVGFFFSVRQEDTAPQFTVSGRQ